MGYVTVQKSGFNKCKKISITDMVLAIIQLRLDLII